MFQIFPSDKYIFNISKDTRSIENNLLKNLSFQTLLTEPCLLYTLDIQRGWKHIQGKGVYQEVPPMNRRIER